MLIQENVALAPHTTFRIGGVARFFVVCKTIIDLKEVMFFALGNKTPIFILGGGSNLLISDKGFDGLVIKIELKGITEGIVDGQPESVRVIAGAGENWDDFVAHTVAKELYGLENLSLIPGTVGASAVQNIGAYGVEAKDTIEWVEIFDPKTQMVKKLMHADCQFAYRDSYFKHDGKGMVVTQVSFILSKTPKLSLKYKDIELYVAEKKLSLTLQNIRSAIIAIRNQKLPDLKVYGTAGSFFKNPTISLEAYQKLGQDYPDMPAFPAIAGAVKISAAWLLDKVCNFKGFRRGAVGVYDLHALVLVNHGGGTAQEIQDLADMMTQTVQEKTGVVLEREVEYVGSF